MRVSPDNVRSISLFQNFTSFGRKPPSASPQVSACLIALNEAPVIARALSSLRCQVDEIIVVDGGSTDQTAEIARAHGAIVIAGPDQLDPGPARQAAAQVASGDWILFLECNETLEPGSVKRLQSAMRDSHVSAWNIRLHQPAQPELCECNNIRLLRRESIARFDGGGLPRHMIGHTNVRVQHWPTPSVYREGKLSIRLKLLDQHLAAHPDDLVRQIDRIHCRRTLAQRCWCDDLAFTLQLVDWSTLGPAMHEPLTVLLEHALLAPPSALPPEMAHHVIATITARMFPTHCKLAWLSAWRLNEAGYWNQAIEAGARAQQLWQTRAYDDQRAFDSSFIYDQLPVVLERAQHSLRPSQLTPPSTRPVDRRSFRNAVPIPLH